LTSATFALSAAISLGSSLSYKATASSHAVFAVSAAFADALSICYASSKRDSSSARVLSDVAASFFSYAYLEASTAIAAYLLAVSAWSSMFYLISMMLFKSTSTCSFFVFAAA
jgi:hypothetical protein